MSYSRDSGPEYTLQHLETSLKKVIDENDESKLEDIIIDATQGDDAVDYDPYAERYNEIMETVVIYAVTKKKWKMFSELEDWNSPDSVNGGSTYGHVKLPHGKTILITAFEKNRTNLLSKLILNALMSKALGIGLDKNAYQFQIDLNEIINNSEPNSIFKYIKELINKSIKEFEERGSSSALIKAKQFQESFSVFEQRYRKHLNPRTLSLYQTTLELTPEMIQKDNKQTLCLEAKANISFFSPVSPTKTSSQLSPAILAALNDLNQKATDPTCSLQSILVASTQLTTILSLTLQQNAQVDKKSEMGISLK